MKLFGLPYSVALRAEVACPPEHAYRPRHRADVVVDSTPLAQPQFQIRTKTGFAPAKVTGHRSAMTLVEHLDTRSPSSGPHVAVMGARRA
jgi:hypothetical protein